MSRKRVSATWAVWLLLCLGVFVLGLLVSSWLRETFTAQARVTAELPRSALPSGRLPDGGRVFPSNSPEAKEAQRWAAQKVGETITLHKGNTVVQITRTR